MRNRISRGGLFVVVAIALLSCDSTINVDDTSDKYFLKLIGTEGNQWGVDVAVAADNSFYIIGNSRLAPDSAMQVYIVKTNPKGEVVWTQTIDADVDQNAKDIEITSDGNLVLVADRFENSNTTSTDYIIARLNESDGTLIGAVKVEGDPGISESANSVTETLDGFVVAGSVKNPSESFRSALVARYTTTLQSYSGWAKLFAQLEPGGGFDFVAVKTFQVSASEFHTFGYTNTYDGDALDDYNYFTFVTNEFNGSLNQLVLSGKDRTTNERLTSVVAINSAAKGYMLAGFITGGAGRAGQDLYTVKAAQNLSTAVSVVDVTTNTETVVTSNFSQLDESLGAHIFALASSEYLLAATSNSSGNDDVYLTKLTRTFQPAWSSNQFYLYGGLGSDLAGTVQETTDGRIVLVGTMTQGEVNGQKKIVLIKVNSSGRFAN